MNVNRFFCVLMCGLLACQSDKVEETNFSSNGFLFSRLPSADTGITFINEIENQKDFNIFKYRNFYNGGGVAIGDINNDGLPDIYMTANMKKNRLYLNKGNMRFEDITDSAGVGGIKPWSTGVLMVDVNDDGWLDIYVSNAGNMDGNNHDNDLYINNGNLTFTEKATEFNLAKSGFSTHAAFFDYDKDGDLDAYLLNNSNIPVSGLGYAADRDKRASDWEQVPEKFRGVGDVLLRNDNGKFVDVSEEAGIYGSLIGFGLGVMVCDLNEDTYPDIYITNDFYERDYLYINNRDGTFSEQIKDWTSHLCLSAMGVDIADLNNDGLSDIFITDMLPDGDERVKSVMEFESFDVFKLKQSRDFHQQYIQNTLQINNGNGTFSEIAYYSGVARTDWSWAGLLFDMDNDGFKDIYVTNGIIHDLTDIDFVDFFANEVIQNTVLTGEKKEVSSIIDKMPTVALSNYAYRNNQDLTFSDLTKEWGLDIPSFSNGCAYADLDLDGDLDFVVNNVNMEAFVFRNESRQRNDNHFIQLQLQGTKGNRFAIGATIKLYINGKIILESIAPSRGFQSSMDYLVTAGIGDALSVDSIHVMWPDNRVSKLQRVAADQKIMLNQDDAVKFENGQRVRQFKPFFQELTNSHLPKHQEDLFDDFNQEPLLFSQMSREGPALAVGDVNGDGNDDVYVGGGRGASGKLFLHSGKGEIKSRYVKAFSADARYEDTAAALFDVDGDGDLDLAVGNGGNVRSEASTYYVRLYINDGSGEFSESSVLLPSLNTNISVIAPADFDEDGDVDLFIGSRSVAGIFGIDPVHALLINDGTGSFTDATDDIAFEIKSAGLITDAKWIDINNDKRLDLVTASDWGAPLIMINNGTELNRWESSLDSLYGWWKVIQFSDFDNDGDVDIVLGNSGENIPYRPLRTAPVKLWINDFDENGTVEQIMTTRQGDSDYPIHMRKELTAQIPALKKKNLKASEYARRSIQEIFPESVIENAKVKEVNVSVSVLALNKGDGLFDIIALPSRVQWSCVCGIDCADVNGDGVMDLILGGNNFGFKPQFSRQDASFGHVLIGDGKFNFTWQDYGASGFFVPGEVRHIQSFFDKDGRRYLIAAVNDREPKVFKFTY